MSSDGSDANDVVSERETQFVYQPGDEEVLWAVQKIIAERGNKYKVKWVGVDPATGKPWAQSWVAKHDCTDDLVVEWKKKKKKKRLVTGRKRGRETSTASRTSGASKRVGPSSSGGASARHSTSEAGSSRHASPPVPALPKQTASTNTSTSKRRRPLEAPVTTGTSSDAVQVDEDERGESSRPRKRLKTMVDVLLPPISSDEEGGALHVPKARVKDMMRDEAPLKRSGKFVDVNEEDDSSPPKGKAKSERRPDAHLKGATVNSRASDVRVASSKTGGKVVPRRKWRVLPESESEDEELRPPNSKTKAMPKPKSTSEHKDGLSEKEVESTAHPIKIGPPRGVKRRGMSRKSGAPSKPGPSRAKPPEDDSVDERVPAEGSPGHLDEAPFFGNLLSAQRNRVDNNPSPPPRISIPQVPPSKRPCSPELSPGAKARLELFDRMMAEPVPAPVSDQVPDDSHFDLNDLNDFHNPFETSDPPHPPSPPLPKSKPEHSKSGTPNGLIVPETESSGPSQSQSQQHQLLKSRPAPPQPLPVRDPSPRKPIDLPTITVIAASATSSPASPQDLIPPQQLPPSTNHTPKRPLVFKPGFRLTTNARSRAADPDPPPSSIESFTSPKRVDKGKQKAVENDQLQGSLSGREGDGEYQKRRTQKKITDSELKKRGKELSDQAQLAREAAWQKIKKPKRLKTVNEIVNGIASSPPKVLGLPSTSGVVSTLELEDVVDLSGGANSTTLDTQEHSEVKTMSEEMRERLRIELRQEEEESSQEAMGVYPPPRPKESEVMNGGNAQMAPPGSLKNSLPVEGLDHVEQPSTDLLQASVIVQASQEQRHEDVEIEPSPANQSTSSPLRPIPENLTDPPRRRLDEVLSLLNVKSEEIQRLERELADERKTRQALNSQLAELQQSSEPTEPVRAAWEAERAQWSQERAKWENDVSTWETQRTGMSQERASLSARLAELSDAAVRAEEAGVRLSELEAERVAWTKERDVMLNDIAPRSEELGTLAKLRGEYDEDRLKWEAERTLWAEEKARWETERAALQERPDTLIRSVDELTASVESTRAAKLSAEKDRDFFREQYVQASAFVGSVRDENEELEKRVQIAEGQAQEGVAAIKALFEGRAKALQSDVDRWKGLTELLQEKDRRTNDELRMRAAQAPDLVELCERLNAENKSLEADVRRLDHAQQRSIQQRNRLFYEILLLKKERASLNSKLSKLAKAADNSTSIQETSHPVPVPSIIEGPESIDPNDMECLPEPTPRSSDITFDEPALFPCLWRPQWRDQCQQIFDTKEDLERHMQEHYHDLQAQ